MHEGYDLRRFYEKLPKWWPHKRRCIDAGNHNLNPLFKHNPTAVKHLFRYGFVCTDGFCIKYSAKTRKVCIYPWPKQSTLTSFLTP